MGRRILSFPRAYFLLMARAYRSAGFRHLAYYPEGTFGAARGNLVFEFGNLMRALAGAFRLPQKG
jgi:hypothetical protein